MSFDLARIRDDFPVLAREVNGQPLAYLDSAASAQKPLAVIEAESHFYQHGYAAVHRGIHTLSGEATTEMENVRVQAAAFLNAASAEEIVFAKGTTEAINLVASSWGEVSCSREIIFLSLPWSITLISFPGRWSPNESVRKSVLSPLAKRVNWICHPCHPLSTVARACLR